MALPAALADLIERWELVSTVDVEGFAADTARIDFAPVDLATWHRSTAFFSGASHADSLEVLVRIGANEQPVRLFTGPVIVWGWERGRGSLEAADARALLPRTAASAAAIFPGVSVRATGRTAGATFAETVNHVAGQVGLPIQNPGIDYTLSTPAWPQSMSWGLFLAWMLRPLQEVRSTRVDLVRRGDVVALQQRSLVLGAPDVTIPFSQIGLEGFRIRRTRPKQGAVPVTQPEAGFGRLLPVALFGGRSAVSPLDTWGFRTVTRALPDGTLTQEFLHGRLQRQTTDRTTTAGAHEVEITTVLYETIIAGVRYRGLDISKSVGGIEVMRQQKRVLRTDLGAEMGNTVITDSRPYTITAAGVVNLQQTAFISRAESTFETKARAGAGTVTSRGRYTVDASGVPVFDSPQHSFSAGDTHAVDDEFGNSPFGATVGPGLGADGSFGSPFMQEPSDVAALRAAADAEANHDHVEVSIDMPLIFEVLAGTVVEISGCPVTPNRFYVTTSRQRWAREEGHRLSLEGEAWVAA